MARDFRFEVFSRRGIMGAKRWYFRLKSGNGEVVAQSEAYTRREKAVYAVAIIRANAPDASLEVVE